MIAKFRARPRSVNLVPEPGVTTAHCEIRRETATITGECRFYGLPHPRFPICPMLAAKDCKTKYEINWHVS